MGEAREVGGESEVIRCQPRGRKTKQRNASKVLWTEGTSAVLKRKISIG